MLRDWKPGLESSGNTYKHKLSAWVYDTPKSTSTDDHCYQLLPFIYIPVYRSKELSDIYIINLPTGEDACIFLLMCCTYPIP